MRRLNIALVSLVAFVTPVVAGAAGIRDYSTHRPPSITLPSAGKSYIDPVFGTKIIRVTSSTYGTHCYHAYSYWPAFNYNDTRLLLACDDRALLFRFDPATDTVTYDGTLTGNSGYKVQWEGATWSQAVADTLYAIDQDGTRLWRINVANRGAGGYTLLKDFAATLGSTVTIDQLTVSEDANIYSFHTKSRSTGARKNAVIWDRSLNKTYVLPAVSGYTLDESQVDKAGKKVRVSYTDRTTMIWDFRAGTKVWLHPDSASANAGGHWDLGRYFLINSDQTRAGVAGRTFGDLTPPDHVLRYLKPDGSDNWSLCDHLSLREATEEFFVGSTYCGDGTYAAFEDEIYLGYTDGHGFVRLAHSRSKQASSSSEWRYRAQPRAVVDRRGRYIVYTSNLGSTSRTDVMILRIPSTYWPDT